jgi:hypothetical protein
VPVAKAQEYVQEQASQCVDETTWQQKGKTKWLWTKSTEKVTVFQIHKGRSQQDARQVIDVEELGVITTDRYPGYNFLQPWRRQLCWAHLKRDFTAIAERVDEESKTIGEALLIVTNQVFELYQKVKDGTRKHCQLRLVIEPIKKRMTELLGLGVKVENSKTARTCQHILKHFRSLWTFVGVEEVEPTNNQVERALRRAVLWRRKSFGTQSEKGSKFVARILTVVATLRQQGRSVLGYLEAVCRAVDTTGEIVLADNKGLGLLPVSS